MQGKPKRVGVAYLLSDKIDCKSEIVTRDKEGHYTMKRGSIYQEDITIADIYAPNTGAPKNLKQILTDLKREINNNTIIVGDFNYSLFQ